MTDFVLVEQKIHHEDAAVQWKAPKANPAAEDRRSPLRFPVCWERLLHRHSHQERPTAEEGQSALGAGSVLYRKVPESPAGTTSSGDLLWTTSGLVVGVSESPT